MGLIVTLAAIAGLLVAAGIPLVSVKLDASRRKNEEQLQKNEEKNQ